MDGLKKMMSMSWHKVLGASVQLSSSRRPSPNWKNARSLRLGAVTPSSDYVLAKGVLCSLSEHCSVSVS